MGDIGCVCMTHVGHSMGVCDGGHWMGVHGGHWMSVLYRALDGSWVYMWPTSWTMHGSSKTSADLVSNTTGLGFTQTTLLEYHMQEWIGHMHYTCMQDAVSVVGLKAARAAASFHNSLGKAGFILGPVAGGFHL